MKIRYRLNSLARDFYLAMGYCAREGFDFSSSRHAQEYLCYRLAEIAYEEFNGDSPDYAEDDEEEIVTEEAGDAAPAVSLTVAQTVQDMVTASVKEVMPFVPELVAQSFSQELNSEKMKAAFGKMRSQMKGTGAGAVFLKQKLMTNRHQMNAAAERLSLPHSSPETLPKDLPENSTESSES